MRRINFIQYFFSFTVFSHYLPLVLQRDFTHPSILTSNLVVNCDTLRKCGTFEVPPSPMVKIKKGKKEIVLKQNMLGCHLITFCINSKAKEII